MSTRMDSGFSGEAHQRGRAGRMGKPVIVAMAILWLAWFFLPAVHFVIPFFQKSLAFCQVLGLDLSENARQISHGFVSLLGLVALAAPFATAFLRTPLAR